LPVALSALNAHGCAPRRAELAELERYRSWLEEAAFAVELLEAEEQVRPQSGERPSHSHRQPPAHPFSPSSWLGSWPVS
jgi:hypothetical protein